MTRWYDVVLAMCLIGALSSRGAAQLPVTRAEAERRALESGTRIALARADSAAALARLFTARALPNPTLSASYSRATPQKHLSVELPVFDALYTRGAKVAQASAAARAARLLYASERIAAMVEIDTTYTTALAAQARFRLSRQTAIDADSLRRMSISRRDAGDVSDLDVDLATVVAGQQLNVATTDSLAAMSAVLTVQTLMGLPADSVIILLADSLNAREVARQAARGAADSGVPTLANTPSIAATAAAVTAAELGILLQQRSAWILPALTVGVEFGDPTGAEPGLLPTIGISVPIPLVNRNQGPIGEARAERDRARALLSAAVLEAKRKLVEATRERAALLVKIARDSDLVVRAQRVADRSLTAYREGASALPAVLEARRNAREVLSQYIDDLAAFLIVDTELRGLTQTPLVP